MPIFEYRCHQCSHKFSALVGVVANATPPACPRCHSADLQKLVSRFARVRSEDEALDALADAADTLDENDPRAMRQFMREMSREMGEDADGEDFEEIMEEAFAEESAPPTSESEE